MRDSKKPVVLIDNMPSVETIPRNGNGALTNAKPHSINVQSISAAIRAHNGNLTLAAAALGVTRTKLANIIERRPTLRKLMSEVDETRLDTTVDKLFEMINLKDFRSITYYLKIKGGKRGYGEGTERENDRVINFISSVPRPDYSKPYDEEAEDREMGI